MKRQINQENSRKKIEGSGHKLIDKTFIKDEKAKIEKHLIQKD